jgi:hypothetical protein
MICIYEVSHYEPDHGYVDEYYPTKAEALKFFRRIKKENIEVKVRQLVLKPKSFESPRAFYCALLSGRHFLSYSEEIDSYERRNDV